MPRGIYLTITGTAGAGKTHFLKEVLVPALKASGQSYRVIDGGEVVAVGPGELPHVEVLATNSLQAAIRHRGECGDV